jgi:hypothetical protein
MTTTSAQKKSIISSPVATWAVFIVSGGLLIASGAIHLDLWDIAYRNVPTLGPLFLVQVIAAFVIGITIIATRHVLALVAGAGLCAGTILGFILVRTVGLFGFKLGFSSGEANTVLVIEAIAVVLLLATAVLMWRRAASPRSIQGLLALRAGGLQ